MSPWARKLQRCVAWLAASAVLLGLAAPGFSQSGASTWSSYPIQLPLAEQRAQPPVITAVALHPEEKLLAVAGDDHVIHIWHLPTKTFVNHLRGHADWIQSLSYASDGRLASAGSDRRVLLWPESLAPGYRELTRANHAITAVAFDADGTRLAVVGFDDVLRLVDGTSGATMRQLACPCIDMRACAWSPTGETLAAAGRNGKIRVWEAATGRLLDETLAHRQRIRDMAFSPDRTYLASGSEDRSIRVANQTTGEEFFLTTEKAKVLAVTFCGPDLLASGGSDNLIRIWDLQRRAEVATLAGHTGSISALAYGSGVLVSAGFDATVRVWTRNENIAAGDTADDRVGALPGPPIENYR